MAVQASLRHADLVAVKCLPRSGVAGVLWRVLFQFFFFFSKNLHTNFHSGCTVHTPAAQKIPPSPILVTMCCHLFS